MCNSKALSDNELRHLTRRMTTELSNVIGPYSDIPAPDMYTDEQTMAWIFDTYDLLHFGRNNRAVVTGKPLSLGGSLGRKEATGKGCMFSVQRFLSKNIITHHTAIKGMRVAVQGFGNVGAVTAQEFYDQGAIIVAISDSQGAIYSEQGLNPETVMSFKKKNGTSCYCATLVIYRRRFSINDVFFSAIVAIRLCRCHSNIHYGRLLSLATF